MSNVIDFKSAKNGLMQKRMDELVEESIAVEEFAADFAISAVMDIIEASSEMGFDVMDNPDVIRDILATVESIRSIIHRVSGDRIEFHNISDRMFENIVDTETALQNFLKEFTE